MAEPSDPLFQEIDEDLRHERMVKLWKRYGNAVIGVTLAIVVAVAGHQGWKSHNLSKRQDASSRYAEAARIAAQKNAAEAEKSFAALAQNAPAGYAMLARFREAALAVQQGDGPRAAKLYRQLAADGGLEAPFRDLALMQAALIDADRAEPKALRQEIARLTVDANPWRHLARELAALLSLKAGERDGAREEFRRLAEDATAPATLKTRAAEMTAALGKKQG